MRAMSQTKATNSIFSRPDENGKETVEWNEYLEQVFSDYVNDSIEIHVQLLVKRKKQASVSRGVTA